MEKERKNENQTHKRVNKYISRVYFIIQDTCFFTRFLFIFFCQPWLDTVYRWTMSMIKPVQDTESGLMAPRTCSQHLGTCHLVKEM